MRKQKSFYAKVEEVNRTWVLIDATDQILGRLASRISMILRGKDQVTFTPSVCTGRNVVVINADKIKVTGNKAEDKKYYHSSGYAGGLKTISYNHLMKKNPTKILQLAVKGMLPDNRIESIFMKSLKIYVGSEHPHAAQKLEIVNLGGKI